MPSPLPPAITRVTGSDGNDIPANGTLNGSSATFSGTGFPNLVLTITLTVNGVVQTPTPNVVTVNPVGVWSVNLTNLPAGTLVTTFTETGANPPVVPPAGSTSWRFMVAVTVKEDFANEPLQSFKMRWNTITNNNVFLNFDSPIDSSIRKARENWGLSPAVQAMLKGNILCFNYQPNIPGTGSFSFSLYRNTSNDIVTCSKISLEYVCQAPCIVQYQDKSGNELGRLPFIVSPTIPQRMTFTGNGIYVVYISDISGLSFPNISCSLILNEIEFTPSP